MSFGVQVECSRCDRQESVMWHAKEEGILCNDCILSNKLDPKEVKEELSAPDEPEEKSTSKRSLRNSTRSYKTRQNPNAIPKQPTPKGKGRRQAFKKRAPIKSPLSRATTKTVSSVHFEGSFLRIGDIVAVSDAAGDVYYAEINGLMIDENCEKSASLTWLVPTQPWKRGDRFDPFHFVRKCKSDLPHKLSCMTFVMHSTSGNITNNSLNIARPPLPRGVTFSTHQLYCNQY